MVFHETKDHSIQQLLDHIEQSFTNHQESAVLYVKQEAYDLVEHNLDKMQEYRQLKESILAYFNQHSDGVNGHIHHDHEFGSDEVYTEFEDLKHHPISHTAHLGATDG